MKRRDVLQALGLGGLGWLAPDLVAGAAPPSSRPTSLSSPSLVFPHLQHPTGLETLLQVKPKDVKYRIAILTDPHLALRDKSLDFKALRYSPLITQQHFNVIRSLDRLTGKGVDLLLMPGDLTRDSEPWNHQAMLNHLKACPFPSLVIPGNHDVFKVWMPKYNWNIHQFVYAYQGRNGGYQSTQPYYAVEALPGLMVIGLNSSDTPDGLLQKTWNGRVDDVQLKWLEATLKKHAGKKQILIQIHHPLIPHHPMEKENSGHPWNNFHTDNADAVLKLMAKYNVRLVFTGHHHINHIVRHPKLPVTEICTAGACSYPSNFRVMDILSDGKQATIHTVSIPWRSILTRIGRLASHKREKFWRLPGKKNDPNALLQFLAGRPQDRFTTISLG